MPSAKYSSMNARFDGSGRRLHGPILRTVSRSFYLSIRFLPRRLRKPVGLAYLLARTTDTVADTAGASALTRAEVLADLALVIQGEVSPDGVVDLVNSFSSLQTNEAERQLLKALPDSLEALARMRSDDREDVRAVLQKITKGQALDIARFGDLNKPRALATDRELHEYTYLVAGCVGEFWTQLCFRHIRNFSDLPEIEMAELGKRYGNGLQLINILRDAYSDLQAGRCYFPLQELEEVGIEPAHILVEPGRFDFILAKWREEAERDLVAGMSYIHAIRESRIRAATALPALIGARTLAMLRAAGPTELHRKIKVPRQEVRAMIARLMITLGGWESIQRMFQLYSGR
jgi:farnesyl-diphosphate farnesyltransferase